MIGDHNRKDNEQNEETRTIEEVFIRRDFVKRTFNNDIALIKLKREVNRAQNKLEVGRTVTELFSDNFQRRRETSLLTRVGPELQRAQHHRGGLGETLGGRKPG